ATPTLRSCRGPLRDHDSSGPVAVPQRQPLWRVPAPGRERVALGLHGVPSIESIPVFHFNCKPPEDAGRRRGSDAPRPRLPPSIGTGWVIAAIGVAGGPDCRTGACAPHARGVHG